jgi:hypothetical protein
MRTFSINPISTSNNLEQYTAFLAREIYYQSQNFDINDPLFLRKLSIMQAEGIRQAIYKNSAVIDINLQETNEAIYRSADQIGKKIESAAHILTSSLDEGFMLLI